jgi:hypothetical protein
MDNWRMGEWLSAISIFAAGMYILEQLVLWIIRHVTIPRGAIQVMERAIPAPLRMDSREEPAKPAHDPMNIQSIPPWIRQHTAVAARTGDGKTFTLYTLLISAIEHKAQCIVVSPQYTDYHPEHQPIDVGALRAMGHFKAYWQSDDAIGLLNSLCRIIDERMIRYRAGLTVGHPICLFIGEWGRIHDRHGQAAINPLLKILDSGRITNVWISYIEYHSALVARTGGDSALRMAYKTRLAGNVDSTTWRAFVGSAIQRQPVARGTWMTEQGIVRITGPSRARIDQLTRMTPMDYRDIQIAYPAIIQMDSRDNQPDNLDNHKTSSALILDDEPAESSELELVPSPELVPESELQDIPQWRQRAIRRALQAGLSRNDIAALIGGNRARTLALIASAAGMPAKPAMAHEPVPELSQNN